MEPTQKDMWRHAKKVMDVVVSPASILFNNVLALTKLIRILSAIRHISMSADFLIFIDIADIMFGLTLDGVHTLAPVLHTKCCPTLVYDC